MSVKKGKLKFFVIVSFSLLLACFLFTSSFSLYSLAGIKEKVDGFALGFWQYDALSQTSVSLRSEGLSEAEKAASLAQASKAFAGFLKVAPVKTASGIEKTNELKSALDKIKISYTPENIAEFNRLAQDFRQLIITYDVQGTKDSVAESHRNTTMLIVAALLLFLVTSFLLFFVLRKEFLAITNNIKENIRSISQGDLRQGTRLSSHDINGVHHELDAMRSSLTAITSSIKHSSGQIRLISSDIAAGNHDLASRTEQQASALQQTAATMEEIKTTVANNTDNARQANALAAKANEIARSGSQVMSSAVASMQKIEQSAAQIAAINHVIDGIAQQTNILALNAAVEAARAGESGRGFAVVATEVRHLAKRSADAAADISQLIQQSKQDVLEGTQQVEGAGKAMKDIVDSIAQVSTIMGEITLSSEEQSSGINQIATALNEMDTVTQHNATLVEKSANISSSMDSHAQQLTEIVSIFTLDGAAQKQR